MINKNEFTKFIEAYQIFESGMDRLSFALTGSKYGIPLFETDWGDAVGTMLDTFLDSHFTNDGCDLVTWWLFEDVDKLITQKVNPDLFNGESEIEYDVEDIEALWDYIQKYKNDYLLNG